MPFLVISLLFVLLERLMPRRRQRALRKGIVTDVLHWIYNGYLFYLGYSILTGLVFEQFTRMVRTGGLGSLIDLRLLTGTPLWAQFVALFLLQDFLMWCTHNLLHRVPSLWAIHRVHHSITTMDWIGNMRYHWGEIVVYNVVMFLPIMILGADVSLFVYINIFNTVIGHFNHANLAVRIGPLKYIFNSPEMHIWHHDKDGPASHNKNFAIGLSLWDWIFGTAYLPKNGESPEPDALGFAGIEEFPRTFIGQQLFPVSNRWKGTGLYSILLLVILSTACLGQTRRGAIDIDPKARSITFTGIIHPSQYNGPASTLHNHHFIVWKGGRAAKNALIEADANDLDVQRALEGLGAVAGNNLTQDSWDKRADNSNHDPDLHVKGSQVDVSVSWSGHAAVRAGAIFTDPGGKGFTFRLGGNEKLIPAWRSGCIVCMESCPGGRVSNAGYTMRDLALGTAIFALRPGSLPADGTVVTVTISLAAVR